ncbi:hypothetical protein SCP_0802170 [Sparassis crispa]|uniref:Uncharacterized protein n=1 Tax=Sparassis crispa TaxID=139825 RepID=A0A401GTY6_9APHY|nr:hypothetical protein SCP_0802170 [Sparassis crispa]GBE85695.1 hypothetical protein SCP_0802170 [Sparassis crispa]
MSESASHPPPTRPPAAHTHTVPPEGVRITAQPARVSDMTTRPERAADETQHKAERVRGGCIPCPDGTVCYIIPIPCCCC